LQNQAVVYRILFRAAAETLRTIAADPTHLGAAIGFFAVLHTWGQTLVHHPYLHCVVPGGGLSLEGTRWMACRPGFFLPVRVLSRLFRRPFLTQLEAAFNAGGLQFFASCEPLRDRQAFLQHLAPARQADWVVYAKRPFGGPQQVLDYVGRYTHRIAISDSRLVDTTDGRVTFRYKNYREPDPSPKTMTLSATEFMRRFLLHVLPAGFHRIRYDGWLGHRHRTHKLARCRELLTTPARETLPSPSPAEYRDRYEALTGVSLRVCPRCQDGHMLVMECVPRTRTGSTIIDSS
jgi:Putative transposase